MNPHLAKLCRIAAQPSRLIIGLMSGTSMDGLDIALCRFSGSGMSTRVELLEFETQPFEASLQAEVRQVFAKREIDFQQLCLLNPKLGLLHGQMVNAAIARWGLAPGQVDLIASHGQTVFHAPRRQHRLADYPNATLQIGDGDHVAMTTGIITLSDFRQKHCAAGGEGAPLAMYGDYLIFSKAGENRLLLNIGGIANFSWLPGSLDEAAVFATDTGPGNTLLDAFARELTGQPYDRDAALASVGKADEKLLELLLSHPFFEAPFPKTTGPELFSPAYVQAALQQANVQLSGPDLMATLTHFTARSIAAAVKRLPEQPDAIYASGGGIHNPLLMKLLHSGLPGIRWGRTDELGIPGDAKEALLFAALANETVAGGRADAGDRPGLTGLSMGKISFPG